ncbi:MAG TPA: hypothetical protein VHL08_10145 [Dongiaceae bacterium]|jgi:hypothetical protein|nr:hypothetical protein [Dongiaceae bacterium]
MRVFFLFGAFFSCAMLWSFSVQADDITVNEDFSFSAVGEPVHLFGVQFPSADDPRAGEARAALQALLNSGALFCHAVSGSIEGRACSVGGSDVAEQLIQLNLVEPRAQGSRGSDADLLTQHYFSLVGKEKPRGFLALPPAASIGLIGGGLFLLALLFWYLAHRQRIRHARAQTMAILIQAHALKILAQEQSLIFADGMEAPALPVRLALTGMKGVTALPRRSRFLLAHKRTARDMRVLTRHVQDLGESCLRETGMSVQQFQAELAYVAEAAEQVIANAEPFFLSATEKWREPHL